MAQIVIQDEAKNLGCIRWMLSGFFLLSVARMTIKREKSRINQEKMPFFEKIFSKSLQVWKKNVPLHRFWNKRHRAFSSAGSEHLPYKQRVGGSNPSTPTKFCGSLDEKYFGRLAQLVQSICLTSRGSAVRIRQRPPKFWKLLPLFGRLAQLVQSICLTSRGSAVRIRQRPPKSKHRGVEQLVARWAHNPKVVCSSQASATIRRSKCFSFFISGNSYILSIRIFFSDCLWEPKK